ncbi:hypothetical protein [Archaeoglobus profundus]|uniref:Uncharacterized protein n=1 Tax=Archaeoglobus profundus (strain DSM 5631 / JCM 9629 / NBRC 100127 / Av18) TaxID=572546 RepID=D2RHA4_ARCPA|nr:hypothetical protein [Archaeoglobus profundus]ADB57679.1 hypothetical protein Arcpr_0614 [Archaeoglobus profundus DSM 5631]
MFVRTVFNIKPESFGKEIYEPPEWRNMWSNGYFLTSVGDESANLVTTKLPAILRKYTHLICILADDNVASAVFEKVKHCFRSALVIGLGIDGCGKNAMVGYETIRPMSAEISFKINKYLNELKSKYGVVPSTFIELIFAGGTSSGYALAVSNEVKKLVRSIESKAQIIDYVSLSRGDYAPQIANSILVTLKLMNEVGDRRSLILSYFDREPTLKKLSDLNILNTIMTLLLSKYKAGINRIDLTDIIGRGGFFTTNTEYRSITHLPRVKSIGGEDIFKLAKRAIDFDSTSLYARAVFHARDSELVRISIISPVKIVDLEIFGKEFEFAENIIADGFHLPIKYIPISVTAFLKGNEMAIRHFLHNHRKIVDEAIPELENYLGTGLVDDEVLENFVRG